MTKANAKPDNNDITNETRGFVFIELINGTLTTGSKTKITGIANK